MIYFIDNGSGLIKIGYSADVEKRMRALRVGAPGLRLLDKMPGNRGHERALHLLLAAHRVDGEWFRDNEDVRSTIASTVANGIEELRSPRAGIRPLEDSTVQAKRLADIIVKCRPQVSFQSLEETYEMPANTMYRLKYQSNNNLSASGFVALLRAARTAIHYAMSELANDLDFIDDLERSDADEQNLLLDLERKVKDLRERLAETQLAAARELLSGEVR